MTAQAQWEYRVVSFGGWRGFKAEVAEQTLNELGQEGWEVVGTAQEPGGVRLVVVAKRPLTQGERRRRSYPGVED
jgi:hypothetical protein